MGPRFTPSRSGAYPTSVDRHPACQRLWGSLSCGFAYHGSGTCPALSRFCDDCDAGGHFASVCTVWHRGRAEGHGGRAGHHHLSAPHLTNHTNRCGLDSGGEDTGGEDVFEDCEEVLVPAEPMVTLQDARAGVSTGRAKTRTRGSRFGGHLTRDHRSGVPILNLKRKTWNTDLRQRPS